ncbi:unnamed protein product [Parajaminaea phylloscopi]
MLAAIETADGTALARIQALVAALVARTGLALPLAAVIFVTLIALYPRRLIGTHGERDGMYTIPGWPILGNTPMIVKYGTTQQFHRFLDQLRISPVPVFSWTFWPTGRVIMIQRPEYLEYVQKTNFENYPKGVLFREAFSDLLGNDGIFVADGHAWRTQRKMASHIFSVNQFKTTVQTAVHKELTTVTALLRNLTDNGAEAGLITLPELFFRYTLSSFANMAFGAELGCLSAQPSVLEKDVPFSVAFDNAQHNINGRFALPMWQLVERFSKKGADMRGWVKEMRTFALDIIHKRLREAGEEKSAGHRSEKAAGAAAGKDLLGLFMELTKDPEDLLVVVLNFIIAGRDTTAQTLSWLCVELMAHPHHLAVIRDEIHRNVGSASLASPLLLDYDDVKKLPYTQACISEALRLHPPVPKNAKKAQADDVIIPQGPNVHNLAPLKVYKGEVVAWSDWVMARTPEVWGNDCEEYNPLRFLSRDAVSAHIQAEAPSIGWRYNTPSQWKFHVFNGGPRRCLGEQLAYFEALSFLVATLPLYNFDWATEAEGQTTAWPPTYTSSVTLPCQPYKSVVRRASAHEKNADD